VISRNEVVDRLTRTFRKHGYDGASLARLSADTGLGRSSLYHHFPGGKADMARAVMEQAERWLEECVLDVLRGAGTPRQRLDAMLAALNKFYAAGRSSCLLGVMTVGDGKDEVSEHVRSSLRRWIEALRELLAEGGLPAAAAEIAAEDAVMRIQGAIVLARGLDDPAPFVRLMERLPGELLPKRT
jgi:AcrR family transcriptional regulator